MRDHPDASDKKMREALTPHISDTACYNPLPRINPNETGIDDNIAPLRIHKK